MYWNIQSACDQRERAVSEYILHELQASHAMDPARKTLYQDVARSVAVYCADDVERGVPSSYVPMLLARALWGVGEMEAAECVLNDRVESRRTRKTLKALWSVHEVSPMLWKAVMCGTVRYDDAWLSADEGPVWVLDLSQLRMTPFDIELARFLSVRSLVRALVPMWDATEGEGVLALCQRDADVFRLSAGTRRNRTKVAGDVAAYCRALLAQERDRRDWRTSPRLLQMT